jgi:hypothetical protein
MSVDVDESLLWTLAQRRIADARELLMPPSLRASRRDASHRHLQAAYYLAGYAVECALKAHVIRLYRRLQGSHINSWSHVKNSLPVNVSGKEGHNLAKLLSCSELQERLQGSAAVSLQWALCNRWDSEVRYSERPMQMPLETVRAYVENFVDACEAVRRWVFDQR